MVCSAWEHNALVLIYLTGSQDSDSNDINERALDLAFGTR
jgi:hypothetical protein